MTSLGSSIRDDRAAIDKAFSLLVAFGDQASTGLGVSELARRANLSKSTAFRVLGMLERNEMVERVGTSYRLGARLHELGRSVYARQDQIRDLMVPFLTELFEVTHQTVHLATLHGTDVVYLAKLHSHRTAGGPSRVGRRLPAHGTAVGKVLLAYDPDASEAVLTTPRVVLSAQAIGERNTLATQLARIRRDGIATELQGSQTGLNCIAAPVMVRHGQALAALSISSPPSIDINTLAPTLRRLCHAAGKTLTRLAL